MDDISTNKNNSNELNVGNAKAQGSVATIAVTTISVLAAVIVGRKIDDISDEVVKKIRDF